VPRFDGDPVFCALLDDDSEQGRFDIELQDCVSITQAYERNTAIVRTEMTDSRGARLEIVDFAPRFYQHGRMFAPVSIVRIVHRLAGRPRIRVRFAPRSEYGAAMPAMTFGSHHIRADVPAYPLRLTTDAPITHVIESRSLLVEGTLTFKVGDDVFEASPGTSVRVAPSAVRSVHNDSDSDVVLVIASKIADDYNGEVETEDGFWPS